MADAVVRLRAEGGACGAEESELAAHYAGKAEGPGAPFGFTMVGFVEESASLLLSDPSLIIAR